MGTDTNSEDIWLFEQLQRRVSNVVFVEIVDLLNAEYTHWVSNHTTGWSAVLPNGSKIESSAFKSAIILRQAVPASSVDHIAGKDRRYAYQEISAALCSMLACINGPTINPPVPLSLSGQQRPISRWIAMANSAGLETGDLDEHSFDGDPSDHLNVNVHVNVSVVGESIVSPNPVPTEVEAGLKRLARLLPEHAFNADFTLASNKWTFTSGESTLNVQRNTRILDALVRLLVSE